MLINTCDFLVTRSCVGDGLAVYILGLEVLFLLILSNVIAFLQSEIQSAID